MQFSPRTIIIGFFAVLLIAIAAVFGTRMFFGMQGDFSYVVTVKTAPVKVESIPVTYQTIGALEAQEQIELAPEITGHVARIYAHEGDWVKQGAPLIALNADKQRAEASQAKASYEEATQQDASQTAALAAQKATIDAAKADLTLASNDYERYKTLLEQDFVTQQAFDEKQAQHIKATAAYQQALLTYESAVASQQATASARRARQASYQYEQARLSDTLLRAPFSGMVGTKHVFLGDLVQPNQPLMTLVKTDPLRVVFSVPEERMKHLTQNGEVQVRSASYPERTFEGHIDYISPTVSSSTRTATIKAQIQDPEHQLLAGQHVQVRVILHHKPNAMLIPEEALIPQGETYVVYQAQKEKAVMTPVQVGERIPGWVEITQGLNADTRVIMAGTHKVQDGVSITEAPEKAPETNTEE